MRVTYIENLPLDGAGTMVNPAYKWLQVERTEYCDSISKAGELWYMYRGGFVHHSIDPTKITRIEDNMVNKVDVACIYRPHDTNPFIARFYSHNKVGGYKDFSDLIREFYTLKYCKNG